MPTPMKQILNIPEPNPGFYKQIFLEYCTFHGLSVNSEGKAYFANPVLNLEIRVNLVPVTNNFYSRIQVRYRPYVFNEESGILELGEEKTKNIIIPTSFLKRELSRLPKAFFANRVETPE